MTNNEIHGWVFTKIGDTWIAATRDDYNYIWNDINHEHLLKSSKMETLIEIIIKCEGELDKILKFKKQ